MMTEEEKRESRKRARVKWYAGNKEHVKEYGHNYHAGRYMNLPEEKKLELRARSCKWARENPEAHRKSNRERRRRLGNNPEQKAYDCRVSKAYRDSHVEETKVYQHEYYLRNKEKIQARKKKQRTLNQMGANSAVTTAIRKGELVRPDACTKCGSSFRQPIEAHHHKGYAKRHWLDVVWLCKSCHLAIHGKARRFNYK